MFAGCQRYLDLSPYLAMPPLRTLSRVAYARKTERRAISNGSG